MYSIGILSTSKNTDRPYLDVLKKLEFQVQIIHWDDFEHNSEGLDVLLIDETENRTSLNCYELILKVRELFKGYLLLITKNKVKTTDLVYLQLGIDGIARNDIDSEVIFIQLKRMLSLVKKSVAPNKGKQVDKKAVDSLRLNSQNISVVKNGREEIELTNTEYQMLTLLMQNAGETLTYQELYKKVWDTSKRIGKNYQYLVTNVVFKLRIKLGTDSQGNNYIRTVRTRGYMFVPTVTVE
ncbi:hypothetical protein UAW_01757 [Enterococcus haemoperoxidus ATCC BAA-382]|uniref:OmpR/PhoB-type domain-containing protein n=1 Tax=Enterococcus haemoperoxidus ATCC BAA-382 TaxID=1158608 RepID=R2T976_9ENTE|nr:winged helix-turn-helix domain-containing protein [Enterococcus haemoperoxidus]EOH96799.1 hypothetical protein UAW_01757 [Enterococcus haemoperoxidus ATCC BAA-382]EOT60088.1 hypothetical protein I583_02723 [Enterococcus haemoperoxidus ATCC BAA-382]